MTSPLVDATISQARPTRPVYAEKWSRQPSERCAGINDVDHPKGLLSVTQRVFYYPMVSAQSSSIISHQEAWGRERSFVEKVVSILLCSSSRVRINVHNAWPVQSTYMNECCLCVGQGMWRRHSCGFGSVLWWWQSPWLLFLWGWGETVVMVVVASIQVRSITERAVLLIYYQVEARPDLASSVSAGRGTMAWTEGLGPVSRQPSRQ